MGRMTIILGGARSGKSTYAEQLALKSGLPVTFIATAQALDEEMAVRIANHRQKRPVEWQTLEIDAGVGEELLSRPPQPGTILLDCLTLLVSNLLMRVSDDAGNLDETQAALLVEKEIDGLLQAIHSLPNEWIIVSNEVGMGLVPPYPLGRVYRDQLGWANQQLASVADRVILMVVGLPMELKSLAE